MREKILDFICEYIDQKLMFTQKQYGISLKKVDNTLMIIIEQMEITNSFYNAEDGFFVFPKPMIKKANFISIKYLYGSDLDIAIYHTRISGESWSNYKANVISNKEMRAKLYRIIMENVLVKKYDVSVNCNFCSEFLIDIQTKNDNQEKK